MRWDVNLADGRVTMAFAFDGNSGRRGRSSLMPLTLGYNHGCRPQLSLGLRAILTAAKGDQIGGELEVGAYTPYFHSTVPLPFSVIRFCIGGLATL